MGPSEWELLLEVGVVSVPGRWQGVGMGLRSSSVSISMRLVQRRRDTQVPQHADIVVLLDRSGGLLVCRLGAGEVGFSTFGARSIDPPKRWGGGSGKGLN